MAELSRYQRQVVKKNQFRVFRAKPPRLGEQVTDLYLAEGKKRTKLWASIEKSLEKLEVPKSRIDRVVASDDAQQLATLLQELWG